MNNLQQICINWFKYEIIAKYIQCIKCVCRILKLNSDEYNLNTTNTRTRTKSKIKINIIQLFGADNRKFKVPGTCIFEA